MEDKHGQNGQYKNALIRFVETEVIDNWVYEHNYFKDKVQRASVTSRKWRFLITIFLGMAERHQLLCRKISKHAIIVQVTRAKKSYDKFSHPN